MPKKRHFVYHSPISPVEAPPTSVNSTLQRLRSANTLLDAARLIPQPSYAAFPASREALGLPSLGEKVPRRGRRGLAGPPAPRSWLLPRIPQRSPPTRVGHPLPGLEVPDAFSLTAHVLRKLAVDWDAHVDFDHRYLSELLPRQKELLLYYVGCLSEQGVGRQGLQFLLESTTTDDLVRLDLTTAIGKGLHFSDLRHLLSKPGDPETWDEAPMASVRLDGAALTHLSLAYPTFSVASDLWASWNRTLPQLPLLSHLCLAGWPCPSSGVEQGASIVRRMARQTLCLQWLDVSDAPALLEILAHESIPWQDAWATLVTLKVGNEVAAGQLVCQRVRRYREFRRPLDCIATM